ncbi:MAG: potassium channel family protein, partial [candidate division Zixibacteria bacterium]
MQYRSNGSLTPGQQFRLAVLAALALICTGTVGYAYIEDWSVTDSLYMSVITLSTVGFSEIHRLSQPGQMFTMVLIIFGVGLGGYIATTLGQHIVEGQFKEIVARRKMQKKLGKLSDHIIVSGFGRVGRQVSKQLSQQQVSFVVIERDEDSIGHLLSEGYLFVQGDTTDEDILRQVRIDTARTL